MIISIQFPNYLKLIFKKSIVILIMTIDIKALYNSKPSVPGTTLITLYIPKNADLSQYVTKLVKEQSTASNIKSKHVRSEVKQGLKSAIGLLKSYKTTKSNKGYIMCAGKVSSYV